MCLSSDPPSRPELSRGLCEVWNGERWTRADNVTVLIASVAFKSRTELDVFVLKETRSLHERMKDSIKKALETLKIEVDESTEGHNQLDDKINELTAQITKLKGSKT